MQVLIDSKINGFSHCMVAIADRSELRPEVVSELRRLEPEELLQILQERFDKDLPGCRQEFLKKCDRVASAIREHRAGVFLRDLVITKVPHIVLVPGEGRGDEALLLDPVTPEPEPLSWRQRIIRWVFRR